MQPQKQRVPSTNIGTDGFYPIVALIQLSDHLKMLNSSYMQVCCL